MEVARRLRMRTEDQLTSASDDSSVTNKNEPSLNSKRASSDVNLSDHQRTLNKILQRRRHTSERLVTVTTVTDVLTTDTSWVSSEALTRPWVVEHKWWLSGATFINFLDTKPRVFGSKTVFLIGQKLPKSKSDLTLSQHNNPIAMPMVKKSRSSTFYLSTPV